MTVADQLAFADIMAADSVAVISAGRNAYGSATGTPTVRTYNAYVVNEPHELRNVNGDVLNALGVMYIMAIGDPPAFPVLTAEDDVTGSDGTAYKIVQIDKRRDEAGPHHLKVHFG